MIRSTKATLSTIAATALRVCVGVIFVFHGWDKLTDGVPATTAWLESLGVGYASLAAPTLIAAELLGGVALVLGLATRFAALVLLVQTGFAWYLVHSGQGFFAAEGGVELVLLLAVALLGFVLTGSARTGLDRFFGSRRRRQG